MLTKLFYSQRKKCFKYLKNKRLYLIIKDSPISQNSEYCNLVYLKRVLKLPIKDFKNISLKTTKKRGYFCYKSEYWVSYKPEKLKSEKGMTNLSVHEC